MDRGFIFLFFVLFSSSFVLAESGIANIMFQNGGNCSSNETSAKWYNYYDEDNNPQTSHRWVVKDPNTQVDSCFFYEKDSKDKEPDYNRFCCQSGSSYNMGCLQDDETCQPIQQKLCDDYTDEYYCENWGNYWGSIPSVAFRQFIFNKSDFEDANDLQDLKNCSPEGEAKCCQNFNPTCSWNQDTEKCELHVDVTSDETYLATEGECSSLIYTCISSATGDVEDFCNESYNPKNITVDYKVFARVTDKFSPNINEFYEYIPEEGFKHDTVSGNLSFCTPGEKTYDCNSSIQLSFFGFKEIIFVILGLIFVYSLFAKNFGGKIR